MRVKGLYVHIPFCVKKCSYCDFYSLPASLHTAESYIHAVLKESETYAGMSFQTLYLGGGTPSLLGARLVTDLLSGLGKFLDLADIEESTIEVNPESATGGFLEAIRYAGINRVSVGVQSLDDGELEAAGRIHTSAQALDTVLRATQLGFNSVSADLIVGLPGQTMVTLRRSLDMLVQSGIEHLSVYCLTLEEDTPIAMNPPDNLPSDDMQADLFQYATSFLEEHQYVHYEISNFARQGHECLHNLNYWRGGEYLGLGPAAASHLEGRRFRNRADLKRYLEDPLGQKEAFEYLNVKEKAAEEAMVRLRLLVEGIDINQLAVKYGEDTIEALIDRCNYMVRQGQLLTNGSRYLLPPSRVLTSNPIFAEVIETGSAK